MKGISAAVAAVAIGAVNAAVIAPRQSIDPATVHYESDYQSQPVNPATVHYECEYQPGGCGGSSAGSGGSGSGSGGSGNNNGGGVTTTAPPIGVPSNTFPVTVVSGQTITFHYECEYQPGGCSSSASGSRSGSAAAAGPTTTARPTTSAPAAPAGSSSRAAGGSAAGGAAVSRTTALVAPAPTAALYSCPTGFNLGYTENDLTYPVALNSVYAAFGNWTNSTFFAGVAAVNATTHTVTVAGAGANKTEVLDVVAANLNTGTFSYIYGGNDTLVVNSTTVSNYTSVLAFYGRAATGSPDDVTAVVSYTFFCANSTSSATTVFNNIAQANLAKFAAVLNVRPTLTTMLTRAVTALPARATRRV